MKSYAIVSGFLVLAIGSAAYGQVVSSRAPVVVPAQYVTSSSPMSDGRVVTTYRSSTISQPANVAAASAAQPNVVYRTVSTPASVQPEVVYRTVTPAANVQSRVYYNPAGTSYKAGGDTVEYYSPANAADFAPQLPSASVQPSPAYSGVANPCTCSPIATNVRYAPVSTTAGYAPAAYPSQTTFRPIVPVRNLPNGAYVGQGLLGQPKAYVQGQPLRNMFRYLLP